MTGSKMELVSHISSTGQPKAGEGILPENGVLMTDTERRIETRVDFIVPKPVVEEVA